MLLQDLFKKDDVNCPEWLSHEFIDDGWKDSTYSFEDNTHKWTLKNPLQDLLITFDGNEYHFIAFHDGQVLLDNVITDDFCIIV